MASPKTPNRNETLNKSVSSCDPSKSANSSKITRSSSLTNTNPIVCIERVKFIETLGKKWVKSKKFKMSNGNYFDLDKHLSNENKFTLTARSIRPRLPIADGCDNKLQLSNNIRIKNSDVEFGGLLGILLLYISFLILVILSKIALKTKGVLIPFPLDYLQYGNYFDLDVYIWSAVLLIIQLTISHVPLVNKTKGLEKANSKHCYTFSGLMSLVVSALIVAVLEYYKFSLTFILDMATKKTVPHVVSSVVFALIISAVLLVTDKLKKQINLSNKLSFFQNLFMGTALIPNIGSINIKLILYRYSFLLTILFNYLVITDSLKSPVNLQLYVVAGLQIFYAFDKLVFECNLLPSFYLQNEKLGYWTIINLFLQPAINFLPIQILLVKKLPINYIILIISSILFLFGYLYQHYFNFVTYKFESSFHSARISYGGGKLTDFGPWYHLKYPNYIGSITAHFAVMLLTIDIDLNLDNLLTSWPAFLYALYYIIFLSHRCIRISTEGQNNMAMSGINNLHQNGI